MGFEPVTCCLRIRARLASWSWSLLYSDSGIEPDAKLVKLAGQGAATESFCVRARNNLDG